MRLIKIKHPGTDKDSKLSGHPKRLDGRNFRHLKRLLESDARLRAKNVASDLNKPVTARTVCIYLKELDF